MARSYRRDSNGRFSGGGGGGGGGKGSGGSGSKSAASRAANTARAADLKAKGTTGIGGRVKAKGFTGGKSAQERAGGLRSGGGASPTGGSRAFTVNRRGGQSAGQAAATGRAVKQQARAQGQAAQKAAGGAKPAKTNKAPANAAKARYKELSGASRRSGVYRSAAENRAAAGAKRSLAAMERNRGTKGRTPKAVKAVAKAVTATYVAGQAARAAVTGRRRRK